MDYHIKMCIRDSTSPTGAEIFFDELKHRRMDIRSLAGIRIAAIGEGTRKILEDRGLLTDLMPEIYDGDCLGETLAKELKGGERILIPRAKKGNENLARLLKEAGGVVDDIPTYETLYESSSLIDMKKEITDKNIDCVVFTSCLLYTSKYSRSVCLRKCTACA